MDSVSRYGKSQFTLETLWFTEMEDAVNDSREQLLTVVSVVIIDEMGVEEVAAEVMVFVGEVWLEFKLLLLFEIVTCKLVTVLEFC